MSEDERHFLHDLSSPLAIASGVIDILLEDSPEPLTESQKKKLTRAFQALERMKIMLEKRREQIKTSQLK